MESLLSENRITLTNLAQREDVNTSTAWRWATRGVKGILLETFNLGGKRFTTEEAFERFVATITAAGKGSSPSKTVVRSSRQKQRDFEASVKFLDSQSI